MTPNKYAIWVINYYTGGNLCRKRVISLERVLRLYYYDFIWQLDGMPFKESKSKLMKKIGLRKIINSFRIYKSVIVLSDHSSEGKRRAFRSMNPEQRHILGWQMSKALIRTRISLYFKDSESIYGSSDKKECALEREIHNEIKELISREIEPGVFG
jgi:hypothetical protein